MARIVIVLSCASLWLCLWGTAAAEEAGKTLTPAAETITAAEAKRHVDVLADDQFEGRASGSRGGRAAGGYLASELQKVGLKGLGDDGGFFQSYAGGRNLLALWEGSDPVLKKQYVMLGAHYDHVGYGNRSNSYGPFGYVHNGADDNASGVAGLLEVVQAFAALPERPKRSIVFALWDGEEQGLLGSKHWVGHPTVPLKNVVLYTNLDMIGRLRNARVEVYGTRTSQGLRQMISRSNPGNLWLDFTWEMKENSDHYSFYERNIPAIMFHTGLHDNYHRPSDDAHLINHTGIEHVARLVFASVHAFADSEREFKFRNEARRDDPAAKRAIEQPIAAAGPRLGLDWTEPKDGAAGVTVVRVTPGLAAAKAGVKVGDRIVKFGEHEVTSDTRLRMLVLAARAPVVVEVMRAASEEPVKLSIALAGSPSRLGIAWRDDPGEPGSVILTQSLPGSAASQAGLKERDRVYEIGGQRFANSREFHHLATSLESPVEVLIERGGRLYTLTLDPPKLAAK
jgi:hypothetical protein